jgi:hypothetical protein
MKIERFEIDSWGTVKLRTYNNGRSTEHEYTGVPKKIILKLLQAKSTPDVSDFDEWMRDHKKKQQNAACGVVMCCDWWDKIEDD